MRVPPGPLSVLRIRAGRRAGPPDGLAGDRQEGVRALPGGAIRPRFYAFSVFAWWRRWSSMKVDTK